MTKLQGTVAPEVMSDIDLLIDAAEKVEANIVSKEMDKDESSEKVQKSGAGNMQAIFLLGAPEAGTTIGTLLTRGSQFIMLVVVILAGVRLDMGGCKCCTGTPTKFQTAQTTGGFDPQFNAICADQPPNHQPMPRKCFACNEWGHTIRHCPGPPANLQQPQGQGRGYGHGGSSRGVRGRGVHILLLCLAQMQLI